MKLSKVEVRMGELVTQVIEVPPHEVALLMAVHGVHNVTEIGERFDDRPEPDPASEYSRMADRYGEDKEQSVPFVAQCFGAHGAGIAALGSVMASTAMERPTLFVNNSEESAELPGDLSDPEEEGAA